MREDCGQPRGAEQCPPRIRFLGVNMPDSSVLEENAREVGFPEHVLCLPSGQGAAHVINEGSRDGAGGGVINPGLGAEGKHEHISNVVGDLWDELGRGRRPPPVADNGVLQRALEKDQQLTLQGGSVLRHGAGHSVGRWAWHDELEPGKLAKKE